jgi:predicted amidophosphoribosyltransferase
MQINIRQIHGAWDLGYSLDKHTLSSTPIGPNEWGHMQFDTVRSEIGEALFKLKYRSDFSQVQVIAAQINQSLASHFVSSNFVVPMPASKQRERQPVTEIAREVARLMNIPCNEELLIKTTQTLPMKDIPTQQEKVEKLMSAFAINDQLGTGPYNLLIIDDLYDTGSSLEAATRICRTCSKINKIYAATVTRRR